MKKITALCFVCLLFVVALSSCKKEEPDVIDAKNFSFNIPTQTFVSNGQVLGKIDASTNKGSLTFSITQQDYAAQGQALAGLAINATTGEITVTNRNGVGTGIDNNCKTPKGAVYTATVSITNGNITQTVTITLNGVCGA
jgi:hypothetical protein